MRFIVLFNNARFSKQCKERWDMTDDDINDYWTELLNDKTAPKGN